MTDELLKRYGEMRSRAEQIRDSHEPKCARIEAAKAQAHESARQGAADAWAQSMTTGWCVVAIFAGLFALAAIFG